MTCLQQVVPVAERVRGGPVGGRAADPGKRRCRDLQQPPPSRPQRYQLRHIIRSISSYQRGQHHRPHPPETTPAPAASLQARSRRPARAQPPAGPNPTAERHLWQGQDGR